MFYDKLRKLMIASVFSVSTVTLAGTIQTRYEVRAAVAAGNTATEDGIEVKEASGIEVTQSDMYALKEFEAYKKVFAIQNSEILSITNNGGRYSNSTIDKAIDGDFKTHWETGRPNSATMTNEVVITFDDVKEFNRLMYAARQDGAKGKGFATEAEIYVSMTDQEDDFELLGKANYTVSNGHIVEMRFDTTSAKRVKFVFVKANQDWASASEFQFYHEDQVWDTIQSLFTDRTYSKVTKKYADVAYLNNLFELVKDHPLSGELSGQVQLALDLVNGKVELEGRVITAEQRGDQVKHAQQDLMFGFGSNNQSTGISALAGETITVYVEAEEGSPLPQLVFSQQEGSFANWCRTVSLKAGKNVITVPEIYQDNWYYNAVTKGGAIYILNPYTEEQQGKAPILRFEGGTKFPFLTEDTDIEKFLAFLQEYKKQLEKDAALHPKMEDRKMIDVFEFSSDHIIFTGTTTGAYDAYITKGTDPHATILSYNNYMDMIFAAYGLDGSSIKHDASLVRENVRLAQPFGAMYAAGNHIGIQHNAMSNHLIPFEQAGSSWGLTHEIGHRMDMGVRLYGESTNNMIAQMSSAYYGNMDKRIPFESHIYKTLFSDNKLAFPSQGFFERIGVFWQLEMYSEGYWADLNAMYRERRPVLDSENQENSKQQYLIQYSSEILGLDLSEHFERHGFTVNAQTKEKTANYPKPDKKIWYLNTEAHKYDGDGFTSADEIELTKTFDTASSELTLKFNVANEVQDDVLGYEISKNGEAIAFTTNSFYKESDVDVNENATYTVVAYAKDLTTAKEATIEAAQPTLMADTKITLAKGESFDPYAYVSGYDALGAQISEISANHQVDTSKIGTYPVVYQLDYNGYVIEAVSEVEVVSKYDHLSDSNWTTASTQWGSIRKNQNLSLFINGQVRKFDKGFGIHANGEMVYDLTDKNYDWFEAFVGVDQSLAKQDNSSIKFSVYADGELVYQSGLIKHQTEAEFLRVNVKDVKTLTIQINNGGNGNTSDHGVIGGVKLLTNNTVPELNIPKSESVKLGEETDIYGAVSAYDIEDGDLTLQVKAFGEVNFKKTGEYTITYQVEDSHGNKVTKERTIAVVDMEDFDYLTDYAWKSTSNSYAAPKVDKAHCGKALRLTDEFGKEVSFTRGLGAHSTSTIIYDLTDKNYDIFSSYVGVDRQMYGTVGLVSFQVFVDGELKYDSGRMNSKDAMKYVEVDINGARELKLVVTDGGNGNGSDHATWGDTKLHYANEEGVDLSQEVTFADNRLKKQVISALGLKGQTVTVGDLYQLTALDAQAEAITSLEGLQYAKNLQSLQVDHNEIVDFTPLQGLKNLQTLSAKEQYVVMGIPEVQGDKIVIPCQVKDVNGQILIPEVITIASRNGSHEISVDQVMKNGKFFISIEELYDGFNGINMMITSEDGTQSVVMHYGCMKS